MRHVIQNEWNMYILSTSVGGWVITAYSRIPGQPYGKKTLTHYTEELHKDIDLNSMYNDSLTYAEKLLYTPYDTVIRKGVIVQ